MKSIKDVHIKTFRLFALSCMEKAGVPSPTASIVVNALITTSLRGVDSHGIRLMAHYLKAIRLGRINPNASFRFRQTAASTGSMDADDGFGIAAGFEAMNHAMVLADKTGIGMVAAYHSSHFGSAGLYTNLAAKKGMMGITVSHVESITIPFNGLKPFFGSNPISISVPILGEDPICMDMATTSISSNKLLMHKASGKKLLPGWAVDAKGRSVTDAEKAVYLTHFGGYKGFALSFMIEVFSSMLTGIAWGPHITRMYPISEHKRNLGHIFCAIDIKRFIPLSTFKRRMKQMVKELRSIPHIPKTSVMAPGDPEKKIYMERSKKGMIPISTTDYEALMDVAGALGIHAERSL
jgi:ureidoglycolate dehydrogenase (NAD+)